MGLEAKKTTLRATLIEQGYNPDLIREFLEEQVQAMRELDKASISFIGEDLYFERELRYSKIEIFYSNLK